MPDGQVGPLPTFPQAGDAGQLLYDLRLTLVLLNEARYRVVARLFGATREQANLVTLIALMLAAERLHNKIERLMVGPPSSGDTVLAAGTLREVLCDVAGPESRTTPWTGTLLTLAVLGGGYPAVKKTAHAARVRVHRTAVGFHRRYGWLIDPGHLRRRRAERRG